MGIRLSAGIGKIGTTSSRFSCKRKEKMVRGRDTRNLIIIILEISNDVVASSRSVEVVNGNGGTAKI